MADTFVLTGSFTADAEVTKAQPTTDTKEQDK